MPQGEMKKLVYAYVDVQEWRDRAGWQQTPVPRACVWSDNNPTRLGQLLEQIKREGPSHKWTGYFVLPDNDKILDTARELALQQV